MEFTTAPAPHFAPDNKVSLVMLQVLLALVPAILCYVWFFGIGILVNIIIASATAVACEALMLKLRARPLEPFLKDYSAIVTAWLLAFALPPLFPWYLTVLGTAFAIVFVKHLYGGLGYNPFNPAMAGYVLLLVSFPQDMTQWLTPNVLVDAADHLTIGQQLTTIFSGSLPATANVDAVTMATPLDMVKTGLGQNQIMMEIHQNPVFGDIGGRGWEWVGNFIFLGGVFLIYRGVIRWHIPVTVLLGLGATAFLFYMFDAGSHATPAFHIFGGGSMLCAFFIATDPVTAATSNKGRLVYGFGIGVLIYVIRTWGSNPDGVAYAVLLMNMTVPLIDYYVRPRTYGHGLD
ncbi:MAG: electron transport complex subunit RsxD [Gammaproteobacteria bacterium]